MGIRFLADTITPTRNFNLAYIILDSLFILVFLLLLALKKEWRTFVFSLIGGILYFIVDFGLFYAASGSRHIYIGSEEQGPAMVAAILFWMSMSYGITNFAFIWLALKKDKYMFLWIGLIVGWWLIAPSLSTFGGENNIKTFRTTGSYHWIMSVILIVGYFGLALYNLFTKGERINLLYLFIIGVLVQLGWEGALLLNGIRPWNENSLATLAIDSLIETNLGMPYFLLIYVFVTKKLGYESNSNMVLPKVKLGLV